jgi:hypothetical protein
MNEAEKLRVLIPHWIEHNEEHALEFRTWANKSGDVSGSILSAAELITQANEYLETALAKLGGPLEYQPPE